MVLSLSLIIKQKRLGISGIGTESLLVYTLISEYWNEKNLTKFNNHTQSASTKDTHTHMQISPFGKVIYVWLIQSLHPYS